MNQKLPDSGIPIRFNPLGYRSRENGVPRRVSVFEAVLIQLLMKEMAGDKRAIAVRLKYQEFVASQGKPGGFTFEYPQDQYTTWLAGDPQRDGTKDE